MSGVAERPAGGSRKAGCERLRKKETTEAEQATLVSQCHDPQKVITEPQKCEHLQRAIRDQQVEGMIADIHNAPRTFDDELRCALSEISDRAVAGANCGQSVDQRRLSIRGRPEDQHR